mmetsp:Transcript_23144/g.72825  ORF Transcript_23144/g.72825 Transcript_23144/m.72825 type:complete len:338 (-) Transcript_23144:2-1015(-)
MLQDRCAAPDDVAERRVAHGEQREDVQRDARGRGGPARRGKDLGDQQTDHRLHANHGEHRPQPCGPLAGPQAALDLPQRGHHRAELRGRRAPGLQRARREAAAAADAPAAAGLEPADEGAQQAEAHGHRPQRHGRTPVGPHAAVREGCEAGDAQRDQTQPGVRRLRCAAPAAQRPLGRGQTLRHERRAPRVRGLGAHHNSRSKLFGGLHGGRGGERSRGGAPSALPAGLRGRLGGGRRVGGLGALLGRSCLLLRGLAARRLLAGLRHKSGRSAVADANAPGAGWSSSARRGSSNGRRHCRGGDPGPRARLALGRARALSVGALPGQCPCSALRQVRG